MTDISSVCQAEIPFLPATEISCFTRMMSSPDEILRSRLADAIEKAGVTPRALSLAIGANHSYVSQILNGKGGQPSAGRLRAMAAGLGVSVDYLTGASTAPNVVSSEVALRDVSPSWRGPDRSDQPGIPLVGTGDCASLEFETEGGEMVDIERSSFDPDHTVRIIARPPALQGSKEIYAIYFQGESMIPRFEPGEVGIVDPTRPPRPGDYVLVQLNNGEEDDVTSVLVKRLVSANSRTVVLHQFNPDVTFKVPKKRVARLHRIMPQTDLLFG